MDLSADAVASFATMSAKLTDAELDRRRRAVAKLRVQLFRLHPREDYHILAEEVVAASARRYFQPWDNQTRREVSLGGLRFVVDGGAEPYHLVLTSCCRRTGKSTTPLRIK